MGIVIILVIIYAVVKDWFDKHPWAYAALFGVIVGIIILGIIFVIKFRKEIIAWIKSKLFG